MVVYVENCKSYFPKLPEVLRAKIKPMIFLYTISKQLEFEIKFKNLYNNTPSPNEVLRYTH